MSTSLSKATNLSFDGGLGFEFPPSFLQGETGLSFAYPFGVYNDEIPKRRPACGQIVFCVR